MAVGNLLDLSKIPCNAGIGCRKANCFFGHPSQWARPSDAANSQSTDHRPLSPVEPIRKRQKVQDNPSEDGYESTTSSSSDETSDTARDSGQRDQIPEEHKMATKVTGPLVHTTVSKDTDRNSTVSGIKDRKNLHEPDYVAHQSKDVGPVVPQYIQHCCAGQIQRERFANLFAQEYQRIYADKPTAFAHAKALLKEEELVKNNNAQTYSTSCKSLLIQLKKTKPSDVHEEAAKTDSRIWKFGEHFPPPGPKAKPKMEDLVLSLNDLEKWGIVANEPLPISDVTSASFEGQYRDCDRCSAHFKVSSKPSSSVCRYHWGRLATVKTGAEKERRWSCCDNPLSSHRVGCAESKFHVFKENDIRVLHAQSRFIGLPAKSPNRRYRFAIGLDCEMSYTTAGLALVRVTVYDGLEGRLLLDSLVRPAEPVLDFNTRFSGIANLDKASESLESIRQLLVNKFDITSNTILIGHGIENDLMALRIFHRRIIDTAILFPHPAGPPFRQGLKVLAKKYLGIRIQQGGSQGHDSGEDTKAALQLVWWRASEHYRK